MEFNLIVDHPDRKEIISRLVGGEVPKSLAQWLKIKYNKDGEQHLHLSERLLQSYMEQHVDLLGQLQEDIKRHSDEKVSAKLAKLTKQNKTYQTIVAELGEQELDVKKTINQVVAIIRSRTEQVFDKIQQMEAEKGFTGKADYALIKYFEVLLNSVEKLDKITNGAKETHVENNYTIQYIDQNLAIFQEALKETLAEFDLEVSMRFMERFTHKLSHLKPPKVFDEKERHNGMLGVTESATKQIEEIDE